MWTWTAPGPQQALAQLPVRVTLKATSVVLTPLVKRLDARQAIAWRAALLTHIEQGPRHLIIDLRQVEWMDSSALSVLVTAFQWTSCAGGSFTVRALQPRVRALFAQTRLDRVIPLSDPAQVIAIAPARARWTSLRWTRRALVTAK